MQTYRDNIMRAVEQYARAIRRQERARCANRANREENIAVAVTYDALVAALDLAGPALSQPIPLCQSAEAPHG